MAGADAPSSEKGDVEVPGQVELQVCWDHISPAAWSPCSLPVHSPGARPARSKAGRARPRLQLLAHCLVERCAVPTLPGAGVWQAQVAGGWSQLLLGVAEGREGDGDTLGGSEASVKTGPLRSG